MATMIDGKRIAAEVQEELQADVERVKNELGLIPGLVVVLVGDDPASVVYVASKRKMCEKLGISSRLEKHPDTMSEDALCRLLDGLNDDSSVHGILVQLPLPPHIDPNRVLRRLDPAKDVDGLHPVNVGLLCSGNPRFIPCTPYGVSELLRRSGVSVAGKEVVILGRSNLVGRPLSILLSSKGPTGNATVTLCHSRSQHMEQICRRADILVAAIGQREFVKREMVKPGAVVIDVGIHPKKGPNERTVGDVDFVGVSEVASMITPVPGGVGPMTIVMLMRNTINAALYAIDKNR